MSDSGARADLPVVAPPTTSPDGAESAIAGVLLAAGTSSRYGDANKLLADVDGEPMVRRAARALLESHVASNEVRSNGTSERGAGEPEVRRTNEREASGVTRPANRVGSSEARSNVVVVLGHDAARVRAALDGLPVAFVENPEYERGQATSVAAGVEAVRDADAAVFALGDMPFVDPASIDALLDVYRSGEWTALAAAYESERGNPVLFDAVHFDALADVDGDTGGKQILLTGERSALVDTADPGVRRDIDTRDAYEDFV